MVRIAKLTPRDVSFNVYFTLFWARFGCGDQFTFYGAGVFAHGLVDEPGIERFRPARRSSMPVPYQRAS